MPPMRGHLPTARVGVVRGRDRRQQHLRRCHPEREAQRPVAVVGVEPVVPGLEDLPGHHLYRLVPGARDLEEDLVLTLELDFLVVQPPREEHEAVQLEQLLLLEPRGRLALRSGSGSRVGAGGHGPKR